MKTYTGDVEITYDNQKEWEEKLTDVKKITGGLSVHSSVTFEAPKLTSVGGHLYVHSSVTFEAPKLTSVGGHLDVYSKIPLSLEKRLWGRLRNKDNKWFVSDVVSDWLIKRIATKKDTGFHINSVKFDYDLFNKVRKDKLTAEEVFAIANTEQRRVAYERMDKLKMKALKDYKVLDSREKDEQGNPDKVVSFSLKDFTEPFLFYNCFCPSTMREYFIQTDRKTCAEAKNASFGYEEEVEWVEEW